MIYVKYKKLTETAHEPTHGSRFAAGFDLYADTTGEVTIFPGEYYIFKTGLAFEIPDGYFGGVYPRSGLSTKHGLRLTNCVGVIDSDYRGDVTVPLYNDSDLAQVIAPHERIGQMIIQPIPDVILCKADRLSETDRGQKGFGSTGRL